MREKMVRRILKRRISQIVMVVLTLFLTGNFTYADVQTGPDIRLVLQFLDVSLFSGGFANLKKGTGCYHSRRTVTPLGTIGPDFEQTIRKSPYIRTVAQTTRKWSTNRKKQKEDLSHVESNKGNIYRDGATYYLYICIWKR